MENNDNPYAPPTAPVADIAVGGFGPPPPDVERACKLLWASLWLGVGGAALFVLLDYARMPSGSDANRFLGSMLAASVVVTPIAALVMWWLSHTLRNRRNWMRWVVTAFSALLLVSPLAALIPFTDAALSASPRESNSIDLMVTIISSLLTLAVIVLLNTRGSRQWFVGQS